MPKKTTKEKSSLSAAPKPKKAPAKRAATRKPTATKAPAAKKPAKPKAATKVTISEGDIALRAYFIAERRQNLGWPGDASSDWLEAKRQLEEEAADQGL